MITIIPRVSEKTYALAGNNVYVFNVPIKASKQQIAAAVTEQYKVKVADVRVVVMKGKAVRASKGKRQSPGVANRKDAKKAYVSLAEGTIEIFKDGAEA